MSSSKSLFEDVKWALSDRKLGPFKTPLKKGLKMHKYAISDEAPKTSFYLDIEHKIADCGET